MPCSDRFPVVLIRAVRRFVLGVFALAVLVVPSGAGEDAPVVRNLIVLIGDGMGEAHVRLVGDFAARPLAMTELPIRGALQTAAANNAVTDSAAAGTALACGRKTNNGMLGQLPDGTKLVSTAELAFAAGKRVGILSSVPINHATPAAYYAKAGSRNSYYHIGLQALASRFDVLGGSAFSDAEGKNNTPPAEKSLWELAEEQGVRLLRTPAALRAHTPADGRCLIAPENLYAQAGLPYAREFDPEKDITLAQMTAKALELLANPNGFFLMVEGGAIDWAGHAHNALGVVAETLAFDEVVAVAKAFAESNPGTLVVVTADHETGGLTLQEGYEADAARAALLRQRAAYPQLADALKENLSAATKAGIEDKGWADARNLLAATFGLEVSAHDGLADAYAAFAGASEGDTIKAVDAVIRAASTVRDAAAGIAWSTGGHTAADVPLFAFGPGAERFVGTQDNTQVYVHSTALLLPSAP